MFTARSTLASTSGASLLGLRQKSSADTAKRSQASANSLVGQNDSKPQEVLPPTQSATPTVWAKRVKGPDEDAWLSATYDDPDFDRSRLESIRRVALNPDLLRMRTFHCYCGNDVNLADHWCVVTNDGTLVCNSCASCHCCSREAVPNSRRLVAIDGMVLCYFCVRFFGHVRRPRNRIKIEPLDTKNLLEEKVPVAEPVDPASTANASNSEYYDYNVPRTTRCGYNPKVDMRRIIRHRYYSPPVKALEQDDDPCVVPPPYLAENLGQPPMQCPGCKTIALGPKAYVVPSMAQVYHKHCFRCCSCKESMAYGYKIAGIAFQYCSCNIPFVWCRRPACTAARRVHHNAAKCRLGCIRPGGRIQADFTEEPEPEDMNRRRKRTTNKAKKGMLSVSVVASQEAKRPPSGSPNEASMQTDATLASSDYGQSGQGAV